MRRFLSAALISCLLPVLAAAAPGIAVPDIPYQQYVLGNGLTLVVHEDHKAPIVAVNVWYHVGSKNEKPGKTGFAHLFEHLMFNGSEHFNDDYFKVLEKIGATDLNGTTNSDRTNYFQNVPVSALDTALWMESDRMGHLLGAIDQARLDEQRGVVQNEKRQGENQPYGRTRQLLQENAFPVGHPYHWTTIGAMEDLSAASLDDVRDWFKTYYGPNNAVVVIAGDIKPEVAKSKVEKFFGDIPPAPPIARQEAWVARRTGTQRQTMQDRVPQARLYKVWNTSQWGTADNDTLEFVGALLSSGKTSRLYKRLVYDDQLATDVAAYQFSGEIASRFFVQATARPGVDLAKLEQALDQELARLLAEGPTADEVERVRTETLAEFVRGVERIGGFGGKSDVLAANTVYGGRPDFWKESIAHINAMNPATVLETARRWLSDGVYVLEVQPFPTSLAAAKEGADRATRPEPGLAPEARFPTVQRATLKNGLKVMLAERHAIPTVQLDLLVDAGYASDTAPTAGLARLAADMLDEGTKTRNALQISEELQRLGAQLSTFANLDTTVVELSALKANLDPSLALMADVVVGPAFPATDFDRLKQQQLAAIGQEGARPNTMALRVLPRLIYGAGHAYSNPFTGSGFKATVEPLTREQVVDWHARWFKPGSATLVVVGDTTLAEITPKLEKAFAGWVAGSAPQKAITPVQPTGESTVYILDRPGAAQSLIAAGHVAPPRANPAQIAQSVMNTALGGLFISRLNMNLREDKHWSYGASTTLVDARGPRPFLALAPVQTDKTRESVAEMRKELLGIHGEKPLTAEELATAKDGMVLTLPGEWETADAVATSMAEIVRFGFDDHYYEGYAAKVRAVTLADVAAAGKLVQPEHLVWVIAGDRAKIEPGLRELGIGPVRVIDADGNLQK